jgi:hypothetical protein
LNLADLMFLGKNTVEAAVPTLINRYGSPSTGERQQPKDARGNRMLALDNAAGRVLELVGGEQGKGDFHMLNDKRSIMKNQLAMLVVRTFQGRRCDELDTFLLGFGLPKDSKILANLTQGHPQRTSYPAWSPRARSSRPRHSDATIDSTLDDSGLEVGSDQTDLRIPSISAPARARSQAASPAINVRALIKQYGESSPNVISNEDIELHLPDCLYPGAGRTFNESLRLITNEIAGRPQDRLAGGFAMDYDFGQFSFQVVVAKIDISKVSLQHFVNFLEGSAVAVIDGGFEHPIIRLQRSLREKLGPAFN